MRYGMCLSVIAGFSVCVCVCNDGLYHWFDFFPLSMV